MATVGDAVAYVSNDGETLLPGRVVLVHEDGTTVDLRVGSLDGAFTAVNCPYDAARAVGGSWSWPGNSYVLASPDGTLYSLAVANDGTLTTAEVDAEEE